jgi:hypothetical protein
MNSELVLLLVVWSFWLFLTASAIRAGVSWCPMTIVPPVVFSVLGSIINWWFPQWGTILMVALHAILWLLLIWVWLNNLFRPGR